MFCGAVVGGGPSRYKVAVTQFKLNLLKVDLYLNCCNFIIDLYGSEQRKPIATLSCIWFIVAVAAFNPNYNLFT